MTSPVTRSGDLPLPRRVLVAVDDSPAALAAVRAAVAYAVSTDARVCLVHVVNDGDLDRALDTLGRGHGLAERRAEGAASLLRHTAGVARRHGVEVETVSLVGEPASRVLEQARGWGADLVVLGRSDVRGTGRPYVGTVTRHVLEFAESPVLVVPRRVGPSGD